MYPVLLPCLFALLSLKQHSIAPTLLVLCYIYSLLHSF